MNDLIIREHAIQTFIDWQYKEFGYADLNQGERFIDAIELIPTAEPKKGRWIEHPMHIECDQCRVWFLKKHLIRNSYCPNCGAKMK